MYFGIGTVQDKEQAVQLYKEAAESDSTKAMLALAALHEPSDTSQALWYYDHAAEHEPYALYKLGEFMESGLYGGNFRSKPSLAFALGFYKKATTKGVGCREALFKLGEYFQHGKEVEKNIQQAIRRYEEAAAEGHTLAMNALGILYYNDMNDYSQATEWFKKASEKGCSQSLCNLGNCYEFGHGVEKNRDMAY